MAELYAVTLKQHGSNANETLEPGPQERLAEDKGEREELRGVRSKKSWKVPSGVLTECSR